MAERARPNDPAYLKAAFRDLGLSEIPGPKHSARVLQLFKSAGHPEIHDDETAWCAAAVGGWLAESGFPNTGSLMARSYVKYGKACSLSAEIPRGAVIVWPRGAPPSGHVNLCLEDDGTFLTCIGGNQSNGNGGGVTISRERKSHALSACLPLAHSKPVPVPEPQEPAEPVSDGEDTAEPVPQVEPAPEPAPPPPADDEPRPTWLRRKWRGVTGWFSGMGGLGILSYLTDPWVIVAIVLCVALVAALFIWFMGPSDVRAWIRKQVS